MHTCLNISGKEKTPTFPLYSKPLIHLINLQNKRNKWKVIKLEAKLLFLGKRKQTLPDEIFDVLQESDQSQKQELQEFY